MFVLFSETRPLYAQARPQAAARYLKGRSRRRMELFEDQSKATQIKKGNTATVIVECSELSNTVKKPRRFILVHYFCYMTQTYIPIQKQALSAETTG